MDKQAIRERVWDDLDESGVARFPFPPHGRIPNFAGADDAAARLTETDAWERADRIKANPDAPQLPVRRAALRAGKTVYVAVPRLRDEEAFFELDPDVVADVDDATTVSGAAEYGVQVGPDAIQSVDLIVSGSVAVTEAGARVGKGEGYSDLEFAVLRECGLVGDDTPVATTVHERQVIEGDVETQPHDVPLDLIVTPGRTVAPETGPKPAGVDASLLDDERIAEIPLLERFVD